MQSLIALTAEVAACYCIASLAEKYMGRYVRPANSYGSIDKDVSCPPKLTLNTKALDDITPYERYDEAAAMSPSPLIAAKVRETFATELSTKLNRFMEQERAYSAGF